MLNVLKCKVYHMPYYACRCWEARASKIGYIRLVGPLGYIANWIEAKCHQDWYCWLNYVSFFPLNFWQFLFPLLNPGLIIPHAVMYSRSLCSSLLDMCTYLKPALWLAAHQSATVTGLLLCNNKDHSQIPQILIGSQQDLQGVPECRGSVLCAVQQVKTLH